MGEAQRPQADSGSWQDGQRWERVWDWGMPYWFKAVMKSLWQEDDPSYTAAGNREGRPAMTSSPSVTAVARPAPIRCVGAKPTVTTGANPSNPASSPPLCRLRDNQTVDLLTAPAGAGGQSRSQRRCADTHLSLRRRR